MPGPTLTFMEPHCVERKMFNAKQTNKQLDLNKYSIEYINEPISCVIIHADIKTQFISMKCYFIAYFHVDGFSLIQFITKQDRHWENATDTVLNLLLQSSLRPTIHRKQEPLIADTVHCFLSEFASALMSEEF